MLARMIGYWHTEELPDDIKLIQDSWKKYGPSQIKIYNQRSALKFIRENYGDRELTVFQACAIPAMQSDVFRLLEILANGGLYLDMGIELLDCPSKFLDAGEHLVLYRRWHGRVVNGIFSAEKSNPILQKILLRIIKNVENRVDNNVWIATGPSSWIAETENGMSNGISIVDHKDLAGKVMRFHQGLAHKLEGKHWHDRQKTESIYVSTNH